jgi:charged multivesicular body protein 7
LIPSPSGTEHDRFVLHSGEEVSRALQTQQYGRPLALGAAIEDAVRKKEFIQLKEFFDAKQSVYAKSWIPTPWQIVNWTLRQLGVVGGATNDDRLVAADFVVMANVEVSIIGEFFGKHSY